MISGTARKDRKTKNLIHRLHADDIAVILHRDLDEVAATHLVERKVKAVINCEKSISGKFPNQGPKILSDAGIPLVDDMGQRIFDQIQDNDWIELKNRTLFLNEKPLCPATILMKKEIQEKMEAASDNIQNVLHDFIDNTLHYAEKEKDIVLSPVNMPSVNIPIKGHHVLIVTRGKNYKEDLKAIRSYIDEVKPVRIGVDGGADALLEFGYQPDIIVGDMDSVSDSSLYQCREIIVHAYPDGQAPGMERIRKLGLSARVFPYPGTSEDVALILAHENKAELIVTVGSHTNMIDFLEKGRRGMASTFLVRMKVGYNVIDAKGVSELYRNQFKPAYLMALFLAVMLPISMVARMSPLMQELYQLITLRLKILVGL
ncbi:putative cytokinetic ring protein SteA [Eubacteriales bacterium mix99]|jgi:uncharacterized membrane-anchored protein